MMKYEMMGLFPTPLYFTRLEREFTLHEKSFVELESEDLDNNNGNMIGKGLEVLNEPAMQDIKEFIQAHLNQYFNDVCAPSSDVKPHLTQSWLNYTYPGQNHHIHMHDNSFISGVLYINANREEDAIMFISGRGHAIRLTTDNYNIFNSETWRVPVHTGDLLLFPSRLVHQVEATSTDRTITRVSLAFNTFIHGEIGDKKSRIHLVLR
jgi:uncharacterized protein (TIGR02466 family)